MDASGQILSGLAWRKHLAPSPEKPRERDDMNPRNGRQIMHVWLITCIDTQAFSLGPRLPTFSNGLLLRCL